MADAIGDAALDMPVHIARSQNGWIFGCPTGTNVFERLPRLASEDANTVP